MSISTPSHLCSPFYPLSIQINYPMTVPNMLSGKAPRVALVTGCNGISGYAIVEHLTKQPETEW